MWATILAFFGKGWERFISIFAYLLILLAIGWAVYVAFIRPTTKPNPSTSQAADTINNFYNQPRISFGCAAWNIKPNDITNTTNTTGMHP
jgi:hypothetical protein